MSVLFRLSVNINTKGDTIPKPLPVALYCFFIGINSSMFYLIRFIFFIIDRIGYGSFVLGVDLIGFAREKCLGMFAYSSWA